MDRPDVAPQGYQRGVPMVGDLAKAPAGRSPTLMIRALRDPDGANLDRIPIIKGWLDAGGKTPVGNTVDIPNATWSNSIGSPYLVGYWAAK